MYWYVVIWQVSDNKTAETKSIKEVKYIFPAL